MNRSLAFTFAAVCLLVTSAARAADAPFSFVVLGDTAYAVPADYPLYEKLIAAINAAEPAFSIHVGDTKGRGDCGRPVQEKQKAYFDTFEAPVFYTPGNNEWAECWKPNRNNGDPVAILKTMREIFWSKPESMGKKHLPLVREADADPAFPEFAENARWRYGGVTFATLNLAGTHNNGELRAEPLWKEFVRREQANLAWVKATFAAAREKGDRAVVFAFHPNIFFEDVQYENGPFDPLVKEITAQSETFPGQILIVQGHHHQFTIDRPITTLDTQKPAVAHPNVTRLQTYGWPDMKAVRVTVDTSKPWVFGFEPVYAADGSVSVTPIQ
jgi:hypothetical protein